MIKTESVLIRDKEFIRTWSSRKVKIHGGMPEDDYDEAMDLASAGRTYTETKIPIEEVDNG